MYEYSAHLVRRVDADTLIVDIDLGMSVWLYNQRIRLAGLNAPELTTQAGRDADTWVQDWFYRHAPAGIATVRTQKDRSDNYGRLLGTITAPDGACLNTDMLAAGHAEVWPRASRKAL